MTDFSTRILMRLEEAPAVRPAFAEALRLDLHRELGFVPAPAVVPAIVPPAAPTVPGLRERFLRWREGLLPRVVPAYRPLTLRAVLLTVLALLLLGCTVAAAYLVARAWLSAGYRGPQYTNDFSLAEAFRQPDALYDDLRLAPDGRSMLAYLPPFPSPWGSAHVDSSKWAIVRIPLDGSNAVQTVMPLEKLRSAIAWDEGTDTSKGFVQRGAVHGGDALSVAENGDLFASVSIGPGPDDEGRVEPPASSALVVIHPDGNAHAVVTVQQLAKAGLVGSLADAYDFAIAATPSAPDRLWARADIAGPLEKRYWLFEIVDPNADGDWSDRTIRALTVPPSLPTVGGPSYDWTYGAFVAEASTPQHDRSRSILIPFASRENQFRLYRISDGNDDGDATDPGEVELLFAGTTGPDVQPTMFTPVVAPRVILDGSTPVIDELVLGGFSRPSRLSRATADSVVDILRALPANITAVAATADGAIYAASQASAPGESGWAFVIYRLTPLKEGESPPPEPSPTASTPSTASPTPTASPAIVGDIQLRPVTPGISRLSLRLSDGTTTDTLLLGADGSGPAKLVPDMHVQYACRSADGSLMALWSDDEIPNEPFVYVAKADGTAVQKLSERPNEIFCPFPTDAIVLAEGADVVRHDIATGRMTKLFGGGAIAVPSRDGRLVVPYPSDTLQVVDVATATSRVLTGPYPHIFMQEWSPEDRRIAFVANTTASSDEWAAIHSLFVVDLGVGKPHLLTTWSGPFAGISWSADGRTIAVQVMSGYPGKNWTYRVLLVDAVSGATRDAFRGGATWWEWSPANGGAFAYATKDALFLVEQGEARKLATASAAQFWPACAGGVCNPAPDPNDPPEVPSGTWLGWSPDGRSIGLSKSPLLAMVDAATGRFSVIWTKPDTITDQLVDWWR